jgi:prepilin-type N-terminal cleavage/methylation domain-containing protein/prepilin-type processing-associated H-X9-DG protein
MMGRRKGFTLIELLVVIAIIAILAAMLFPVFARARESARKIQCLANVKNIATAVQMYLVDYDRFPPREHNPMARQLITDYCQRPCPEAAADCRATEANPYLRWPVILEDYVKNRDVWRCPSARFVKTFGVNWGYGTGKWAEWLRDQDRLGCSLGVCSTPFPPGWGGSVTDSYATQSSTCAGGYSGGFDQSIGYPRTLYDLKTGQMTNPARYAVAFDAGVIVNAVDRASWVAYPDTCRIDSVACTVNSWQCGADWVNCPWTQDCGAQKGDPRWSLDPQFRKDHAKSRHLGGSNIGFADGHAAWMASETILWNGENWSGYAANPDDPLLLGLGVCTNPNIGP